MRKTIPIRFSKTKSMKTPPNVSNLKLSIKLFIRKRCLTGLQQNLNDFTQTLFGIVCILFLGLLYSSPTPFVLFFLIWFILLWRRQWSDFCDDMMFDNNYFIVVVRHWSRYANKCFYWFQLKSKMKRI